MKNIKLFENFRTDDAKKAFDAVTELSAQELEEFLFALSKYFDDSKEELTNMNAEDISKSLHDAAEMVQNRSGN